MITLVVLYNGKKIKSYSCKADKINEGIEWLSRQYPQCTIAIR